MDFVAAGPILSSTTSLAKSDGSLCQSFFHVRGTGLGSFPSHELPGSYLGPEVRFKEVWYCWNAARRAPISQNPVSGQLPVCRQLVQNLFVPQRSISALQPPERRPETNSRFPITLGGSRLRQDDDYSHHSQLIVQHAFVLVHAGLGEGRPEARCAVEVERSLRQTNAILRQFGNEARVHGIRRGVEVGVASAIRIHRDVGRRRNLMLIVGFRPEGYGVAGHSLCRGPLHGLADLDDSHRVHEAHNRGRFCASSSANDLTGTSHYSVVAVLVDVRRSVDVREQGGALVVSLTVVESLVMRQWHPRIQHMDGGGHVGMSQADQLEVTGHGKDYRVCLPVSICKDAAIHTCVVVKDGKIRSSAVGRQPARATGEAIGSNLT